MIFSLESKESIILLGAFFKQMKNSGAISSVGRAPRLHRDCQRFESVIAHLIFRGNSLVG